MRKWKLPSTFNLKTHNTQIWILHIPKFNTDIFFLSNIDSPVWTNGSWAKCTWSNKDVDQIKQRRMQTVLLQATLNSEVWQGPGPLRRLSWLISTPVFDTEHDRTVLVVRLQLQFNSRAFAALALNSWWKNWINRESCPLFWTDSIRAAVVPRWLSVIVMERSSAAVVRNTEEAAVFLRMATFDKRRIVDLESFHWSDFNLKDDP